MSSSRPSTDDEAGFADDADVEHEHRDNLADDRLPSRPGGPWCPC